jgi:ubiquinone/menaquinone biosynthesis C-methylase UbiE
VIWSLKGKTGYTRTLDVFIERKIGLHDPWYQLIMKMFGEHFQFQGKRILEVGCGLGGFCIKLAEKGAVPIGLDVSRNAVKKAKDLARRYDAKNQVEFIIGDAQFLPFKDGSCANVICSETLEHVEDYEQAFSEIVRTVENQGQICITLPNLLSTMFPVYIFLLLKGQPRYAKEFLKVEKEGVFHYFKIKRLFNRKDLEVIKIQSTDFLYLPPRIKNFFNIERHLQMMSDSIGDYFERCNIGLRYLGANIGVLARKVQ